MSSIANQINLYPFQTEILNNAAGKTKNAFFLDMGLGKTFIGAEQAYRNGNKILVVCQKSKINDWINHFQSYYTLKIFNLRQSVNEFIADKTQSVGVINYDLIWRRPEINTLKNYTLLLDESSEIQNHKAKRTKSILKLKPDNVILLSGTPTSGKYEHLYSQMKLLGMPINLSAYESNYVNWDFLDLGFRYVRVPNKRRPYKNVKQLKNKLREYGAQFLKTEEVFDLPQQNFIEVKVPKSREYKRFERNRVLTIDNRELIGDTQLTQRLYLRQLAGGYSKNKLEACKDLMSGTQDRLIIFYNFDFELDKLCEIAKSLNRPISQVNGHKKDLAAYETEDNSVTLIQYQAGAMGLNLQKANKIIYFTLPERSDLYEQSKKRIHRIGQNQPCFYYLMLTEDSIETEEVLPNLKKRKDYTDDLFKG